MFSYFLLGISQKNGNLFKCVQTQTQTLFHSSRIPFFIKWKLRAGLANGLCAMSNGPIERTRSPRKH